MTVKLLFAAAMMALAGLASAQGSGARGTLPPGTAADGSRPADGAIKGGILPGESSGVPDKSSLPEERMKRCDELGGTLREECLLKEQDAAAGSSRPAPANDATKSIAPPDAPPPQNPR